MLTSYAVSLLSINIEKRTCTGRQRPPSETWRTWCSINFLCDIMLPVSRCRSVLSGHNTTRDTPRHFQRAQPFIMSADCTANTSWQPKHDTWLGVGDRWKQWSLVALSTEAMQSVSKETDIVLCYFKSICRNCWQEPRFEGYSLTHTSRIPVNQDNWKNIYMSSKFCSHFQNFLHDNQNGNTQNFIFCWPCISK